MWIIILNIKDSVCWVSSCLILCCVSNQSLLICEGDVWRCNSVTLIVYQYFNFAILHHTDTGVCSSEINTNDYLYCISLCHGHEFFGESDAYQLHSSLVSGPELIQPQLRLSGRMLEDWREEKGRERQTSPWTFGVSTPLRCEWTMGGVLL